nr:MAG TPA: hypothetical protein [Caudoviricetes sp.]
MLKIQMDLTPDIIQDIKQLFYLQEHKFSEILAPVVSGGVTPEQVTTKLMQARPIFDKSPQEIKPPMPVLKKRQTPKGLLKIGDTIVYSIGRKIGYIGDVTGFHGNIIELQNVIFIDASDDTQYFCVKRIGEDTCPTDNISQIIPKTNDQTPKN